MKIHNSCERRKKPYKQTQLTCNWGSAALTSPRRTGGEASISHSEKSQQAERSVRGKKQNMYTYNGVVQLSKTIFFISTSEVLTLD